MLNKYIKIILSNIASQNIICSTLLIFVNVTMKIFDSKSLLTCLILTQPLLVASLSTWTMISVLSMLRYLMAWKASKTQLLNGHYVITVIIIGAILPYLNLIFNLFVNEFKGKHTDLCLDLPSNRVKPVIIVHQLTLHCLCWLIILIFDIMLVLLIFYCSSFIILFFH